MKRIDFKNLIELFVSWATFFIHRKSWATWITLKKWFEVVNRNACSLNKKRVCGSSNRILKSKSIKLICCWVHYRRLSNTKCKSLVSLMLRYSRLYCSFNKMKRLRKFMTTQGDSRQSLTRMLRANGQTQVAGNANLASELIKWRERIFISRNAWSHAGLWTN